MERDFIAVALSPSPGFLESLVVLFPSPLSSAGETAVLPQVLGGVSPDRLVVVTGVTACAHRRPQVTTWLSADLRIQGGHSPGPRASSCWRRALCRGPQDPAGHQLLPQKQPSPGPPHHILATPPPPFYFWLVSAP